MAKCRTSHRCTISNEGSRWLNVGPVIGNEGSRWLVGPVIGAL